MGYVYHLPVIHNSSIAGQEEVMSAEQQALLILLTMEGQLRLEVVPHPTLMQVAQAKAQDMAERNYLSHVDLDGYGPNYHVRTAGYHLPKDWPTDVDKNYIESLGGGYPTAERVWVAWLGSPGHRAHALGEHFYSNQTQVGVGYAKNSDALNVYYWVLLSAPPEE